MRLHDSMSVSAACLVVAFGLGVPADASAQYYSQTNVALGKPVTAVTDTVLGGPSNVTDGDFGTSFYSYQGTPSQQIYTIDLGASYTIGKVFVYVAQARHIEIHSSLDGDVWDLRASFDWGQMVSSPVTMTPDGSYAARYFKYVAANADDAYVGSTELAVYPWVAEAPPAATGGNAALGKPATDQYTPVTDFEAAKAVDGDVGTAWKGSYVEPRLAVGAMAVDLGAPTDVGAIRVHQDATGGSHAFLVALSDDGAALPGATDWIAYGDPTLFGTDTVLAGTREFVLPQVVTHQFVWVVIYNNVSPSSLLPGMLEVEVLSPSVSPVPTATPTATPTPTLTPTPVPTTTPGAASKCDAGKIRCVATKQACLLDAHGKAEKKGVPVDALALLKCRDKFDGGSKGFAKGCIGKLEAKADVQKPETLCTATGDLAALEAAVDLFVAEVVGAIDPSFPVVRPANSCDAGKKGCVRTKARCLLTVESNAAKKNVPVDQAALSKCKAKFDGGSKPEKGCIAKLEAKQNPNKPKTVCSVTGDRTTLESMVDAFVADLVRAVRAPE
jgi:hypothetical protein